METMFMNTENSKTNQPHKFVVNLSQRLDVKSTDKKKKKKKKSTDKHVALQNLSTYCTCKNIKNSIKTINSK